MAHPSFFCSQALGCKKLQVPAVSASRWGIISDLGPWRATSPPEIITISSARSMIRSWWEITTMVFFPRPWRMRKVSVSCAKDHRSMPAITGGELTKNALALVDGEKFTETHYQRAGYGKIQFDCDFGPTMFQEVRQAVAYLLNRTEFCQTFTGGYGVVVDGPYSPDFASYRAVQDDIELIDYSFSPDTAISFACSYESNCNI